MMAIKVASLTCSFNYDKTFPREYGGINLGSTFVTYLDYQKDSSQERLALVGFSYSTDFLSQTNSAAKPSNFIIYENA